MGCPDLAAAVKLFFPEWLLLKLTKHNHHHRYSVELFPGHDRNGKYLMTNPVRMDIEEAATLAGLDFIIDVLFNKWGETNTSFRRCVETGV